jgi:hypothetical protein
MTFDDQLRRAFDTLSDRLRNEIERQVEAVIDELAASARVERDAVVTAARRDRDAALATAQADRDAALASIRAEHDAAIASAHAELEAAVAAARADGDAAVAAARAAGDAAVAAARADREAAVASAHAEHEAAMASAKADRDAAVEAAVQAALASVPQPAPDEPTIVPTEALEPVASGVRAMAQASSLTAVLHALMKASESSGAVTNVWLVRGQHLEPWRLNETDAPAAAVAIDEDNPIAEAARSNALARRDEVIALPVTIAGDVVCVLVAASTAPQPPNTDALEALTLYASKALEAITAFKTARALTRHADDRGPAHAPATGEVSAEEHASAQRYARLLVSEIKLYHEADVVEGRRGRDLASRLGGEIARARVMYEERVPPQVRRQADYFHDELVRTLADGDATLLEVRS